LSVYLSIETSRQSDWDGIVACHRGEKVVTTWSFNRCTMGSHRLQHQRFTDDAKAHRHTSALVRPHHVLQPLIPDRPPSSYDLRLRTHDKLLLNKTSYLNDREFIIHMLYKDRY